MYHHLKGKMYQNLKKVQKENKKQAFLFALKQECRIFATSKFTTTRPITTNKDKKTDNNNNCSAFTY